MRRKVIQLHDFAQNIVKKMPQLIAEAPLQEYVWMTNCFRLCISFVLKCVLDDNLPDHFQQAKDKRHWPMHQYQFVVVLFLD